VFINGKCHCGNIAFELEWEGDPQEIPARACGCSFCAKHGGVWTSNPKSRLAVTIRDASLVSKYAFGSRTATFHVCSRCGTVPLLPAKSRIISMQLSTSMCWRMSTNRGYAKLQPTSKAKMLNLVLRAEGVTGLPMFALQKGVPNLSLNPDASPAALSHRSLGVG
jgi:hypothetical protein